MKELDVPQALAIVDKAIEQCRKQGDARCFDLPIMQAAAVLAAAVRTSFASALETQCAAAASSARSPSGSAPA